MKKNIFLLLSFICISYTKECENILKSNSFFDLNQKEKDNVLLCNENLSSFKIIKKLYLISSKIRGDDIACAGISYIPKFQEYNYLLFKMLSNPLNYEKYKNKNFEDNKEKLQDYFKYWAYQSIGNFILYNEFINEYENTFKNLILYFKNNFNLNDKKASNISLKIINEITNWAIGETKIFKKLNDLEQIVINKNHDSNYLKSFLKENNFSTDEFTNALNCALLAKRDEKNLKILIEFGADINYGYENSLFYALQDYNNAKFLIQNGVDVNQSNSFGKTPLFYAIEYNLKDIINLLIQNNANINAQYINLNEKLALSSNVQSNTPYYITFCALKHTSKSILMHAAYNCDVEILKILVKNGANIKQVDDLGFNALDFAISAKKDENIKYLKSLGLKQNENLLYEGSLE